MWNSDSTTRYLLGKFSTPKSVAAMSALLGCMSFGVRSLMDSDQPSQLDCTRHSKTKATPNTLSTAATVEMIHNTLKSTQPPEHSPRSTHSAAQRKLWRYSGCRGAAGQVENQRRSVCVLAADLNAGEGGGRGGGGGVMHTIHGLCHLCIRCRLPQVTILRGKDGYGFTICSDSPVRVQAVDPGKFACTWGPADQAGLQQLDTLLQLNGQPVEQWKCVDLAHAIRNSANEITVVVWRTGPSAKPNFEGLIHRPSYKPSTSNYDAPSPPTRRRVPDVGTSKTPQLCRLSQPTTVPPPPAGCWSTAPKLEIAVA
ncbi:hypothetical protein INR49_032453 [Caranx melampygus]|nr:hypothetical protein INR49_032453 [Caranx melampygus]